MRWFAKIDLMVRLLVLAILLASFLPAAGNAREIAQWISNGAIFVLFFLNGLRLPRDEVLARQKDIAAGKLHPFAARTDVKDNEGRVVIAKGQTLTDEAILNMNWLAEGVLSKLPK